MVRFRLSLFPVVFSLRETPRPGLAGGSVTGESVLTVGPAWPSEVLPGAWPLEGQEEN